MRIAIHVDGPIIRGNERQVIRIAAGLRDRGHHVAVSCRREGPARDELAALGIPTTSIRPGGDADFWNATRFAAWLRRERMESVLLTSWKRTMIAAWAAAAGRVPRIVYRIGDVHPIGTLERLALTRWYTDVIANSRKVGEAVRAAVPGMAARVHVVVNGMEGSLPEPAPVRQELGLGEEAILLAGVGAVERRKGFDLLIEGLPALDARVHAVLVGGGSDADRARLEAHARERGVADRVHFLGRRADGAAVTAGCDAFVLPSRSEGFSVAMLEAMALGRPVVMTDVGGAWEGLAPRDGRPAAGWIVPVDDVRALSSTLREVVDGIRTGAAEVRARTAEAVWRARNWFTLDAMIDGYEAVLTGRAAGGVA